MEKLQFARLPYDIYWEIFERCDELEVWNISQTCRILREVALDVARVLYRASENKYHLFVQNWEAGRFFTIKRTALVLDPTPDEQMNLVVLAGYVGGRRGECIMNMLVRGFPPSVERFGWYLVGRAHRGLTADLECGEFIEYFDLYPYAILSGLAYGHHNEEFKWYFEKLQSHDPTPRLENPDSSPKIFTDKIICPLSYLNVLRMAAYSRNYSIMRTICELWHPVPLYKLRPHIPGGIDRVIYEGIYSSDLVRIFASCCRWTKAQWDSDGVQTLHYFYYSLQGADWTDAGYNLIMKNIIENDLPELYYYLVIKCHFNPLDWIKKNPGSYQYIADFLIKYRDQFERWSVRDLDHQIERLNLQIQDAVARH